MTGTGPDNSDSDIRLLEQEVANDPESERFAELAEAWVATGRYAEAVQLCETGLGFHPAMPDGHLAYAKALVSLGRLDEGIKSFERTCILRSNDAGIHATVGLFLIEHGHQQAAIPYLENGLRVNPDDPQVIDLQERMGKLLEDQAIAQPNRNEPPTVFADESESADESADEKKAPSPWSSESLDDLPRQAEPPTVFDDGKEGLRRSEPEDSTRVSTSRPRGPMFPEYEPFSTPTTSISYLKVFLVVVPFVMAAVAGGLYFGYRYLRNEKISSLFEQSLGAMSQDTFAGYGDARATLLKLLELEEDHRRGQALLAMVSARLHDEFGPNLDLREKANALIEGLEPDEETAVDLLWARFHTSGEQIDGGDSGFQAALGKALRRMPTDTRLMALAGEMAVLRGEKQKGIQWLQASLADDPSNPRVLAALAELEMETGQRRQAGEHLVRSLAINAIHVRSLLALSRLRVEQGTDLDRAREDLEKALKLPRVTNGRRAQAFLLYANLGFQTDQRSRALSAVKAASSLLPDDAAFQRELALLCLRYFELDEATVLGNRVVELSPDDMNARLFLVSTELPRGRARQALEELDRLVGKKVTAAPFLLLRGEALLEQGRYQAALNDLRSVPEDSAERPRSLALQVLALLGAGEISRARKEALALQKKHPDLAMTHLAMGQYRLAKRLRRGAAAAFRKAIQLDKRCYQAHERLARMDFDARRYADAEQNLALALAANPYDVVSYFLLGQVKLRSGDPQAALDSFARVVKEQPDSGSALVGMAEALLDQGRLKKAMLAIRKGRKAGADDVHARHVEGQVYLANGRFHTAIRSLKAADELKQKDPEILADLGLALLGLRSITRAEKAFNESLKYSRKSRRLPRAQEGLARVLSSKRSFLDAARAFERAAVYSRRMKRPATEVTRLYLEAGRAMLEDTRSDDKRFGRARRLFRLAARSASQDAEPLYEVAATYDREEKLRLARKAYRKVLQIAPQHQMTLYRLGLLEFDDGKDERARELLMRFLETKPGRKLARMARKVLKRIK